MTTVEDHEQQIEVVKRVPLSVVIPAYKRINQLFETLNIILRCNPLPQEIIIHVDGGQRQTAETILKEFPTIQVIFSPCDKLLGPGGSRDVLIKHSANDWVISFDDDSYPGHVDFFSCVMQSITKNSNVAIFSAACHEEEKKLNDAVPSAVFSGCGCVYNKLWYSKVPGYVPRPTAYNFEEVDLSLQLYNIGGKIMIDPRFWVIHNHPIISPFPPKIVAATFLNMILFPLVRYPFILWPLGVFQFLKYVIKPLAKGQWLAFLLFLIYLPKEALYYLKFRSPVSFHSVINWLLFKRACPLPPK